MTVDRKDRQDKWHISWDSAGSCFGNGVVFDLQLRI